MPPWRDAAAGWLRSRPGRFAIVGTVATVASLAAFAAARVAGLSGVAPTALRLAVALPILYAGYSRWMLADVLAVERTRVGRGVAELRMAMRIAAAVGASALTKLAIEPWLVDDLIARGAADLLYLAPLAGDLVYGPAAAYLVLAVGARVRGQAPRAGTRLSRTADRPGSPGAR